MNKKFFYGVTKFDMMLKLLQTNFVQTLGKSLLLFLIVTAIPSTLVYIDYTIDIQQNNNVIYSADVNIEDNTTNALSIGNLPITTQIQLEVNWTDQPGNGIVYFNIVSEDVVENFNQSEVGNRPGTFYNTFRTLGVNEETKSMTQLTDGASEFFILYFSNEEPDNNFNLTMSYYFVVEAYIIRKGWSILFTFGITYIIAFAVIPYIRSQLRHRKRRKMYRNKLEREEEDFRQKLMNEGKYID